MEAAPSPLGVATASTEPPPGWVKDIRWPPASPPAAPPLWTRSTQVTIAALLTLALGLLGWYAYSGRRAACRPTVLDADMIRSARVDLNRADHAELLQLPGVGAALARRIEDYRTEHGGFRSVDELRRVAGIGPAMLERLRPFVDVEAGDSDAAPAAVDMAVPPAGGKKQAAEGERIDVNAASAARLQTLPGIGPKMSQRIVEIRAQKPFRSVDDLRRVPGIGPKTLERLRPHVTAKEPSSRN